MSGKRVSFTQFVPMQEELLAARERIKELEADIADAVADAERFKQERDEWERKSRRNGLAAAIGLERLQELQPKYERTREALAVVLDQVDYTAGNCGLTDYVGAVLPKEVIKLAREALERTP